MVDVHTCTVEKWKNMKKHRLIYTVYLKYELQDFLFRRVSGIYYSTPTSFLELIQTFKAQLVLSESWQKCQSPVTTKEGHDMSLFDVQKALAQSLLGEKRDSISSLKSKYEVPSCRWGPKVEYNLEILGEDRATRCETCLNFNQLEPHLGSWKMRENISRFVVAAMSGGFGKADNHWAIRGGDETGAGW